MDENQASESAAVTVFADKTVCLEHESQIVGCADAGRRTLVLKCLETIGGK